ncbi:DUF488 domain-containing protein [Desulfosarcina sp. OttesenSCG-928-A07]|nr:DUF488 domain-containing protein [Desulfosarcina sp. OttesenSCG-928-G17]MDL2329072.1 DUF488 domain-containing protein [Desulfosarcina sp. OttesenSCG-928-A07]
MDIAISYFQSKAPNERKVCIAKKPFRFLPGLMKAELFAPSNPWAKDWQSSYLSDLKSRFPTPESLRVYLEGICRERQNPILCCYEKNPAECHRSILAAYIQEKLGITVPEWTPEQLPTL